MQQTTRQRGSTGTDLAELRLRRREERRLRAGHVWIYSNEVDIARTPLREYAPGELVKVCGSSGKPLGIAYVNPRSLICARLLTRSTRERPDTAFFARRLRRALALRERVYELPYYRLVHGEADGLPGLIVDRYGSVLVAQTTTAGMERLQDEILAALEEVLAPGGVLWRNDHGTRELEGLERDVRIAAGEVPDEVELIENGARFRVSPAGGQKTGWYYDQRDNRAQLARYVRGARVLDLCAYAGGWGVQAALAGAGSVLCVDASARACELTHANASRNGVAVDTLQGDVFDALRELREADERFDVIVADPPAFVKRKRDLERGRIAYLRLNTAAMRLASDDALIVSCSCSFHFSADDLSRVLSTSARKTRRGLQLIERGAQAADHPVHPAIPETAYLKAWFARVIN